MKTLLEMMPKTMQEARALVGIAARAATLIEDGYKIEGAAFDFATYYCTKPDGSKVYTLTYDIDREVFTCTCEWCTQKQMPCKHLLRLHRDKNEIDARCAAAREEFADFCLEDPTADAESATYGVDPGTWTDRFQG
jgi:hypothetical protein